MQLSFWISTQNRALIAIGANTPLGDCPLETTIKKALGKLETPACRVLARSRLFKTPCFPTDAGPDYLNAVVLVQTSHSSTNLLQLLHGLEAEMGRERVIRWGNRTLDLDLLAFGDAILPDRETYARWRDLAPGDQRRIAPDRLILPHPRMHERAFVLVPLLDIAPDWRHPVTGLTVREMTELLDPADRAAVVPL